MDDLELLEKAIGIAVEAHRGKKDKYGAPYILHPLRVMSRLRTRQEQIVGILHDVVEDTDWTFNRLREEGFPAKLLNALECVTKREGEPYEAFVQRSAGNPLARKVKLADLEDNMDVRRYPALYKDAAERLEKYLRAWRTISEADQKQGRDD